MTEEKETVNKENLDKLDDIFEECKKEDESVFQNLIINGNVDGEINCESLEIGPSGVVTGTVKAGQCFLAGKLEGKLSARTVNIASTGDLNGRLSYGKLEIETGANIALKLRKTKQLSDASVENSDGNEEQ